MTTRLDKPLRRELELDGKLYTVTISPDGVKVVEKGKRLGREISWQTIVSGDAELRESLRISVDALKRDACLRQQVDPRIVTNRSRDIRQLLSRRLREELLSFLLSLEETPRRSVDPSVPRSGASAPIRVPLAPARQSIPLMGQRAELASATTATPVAPRAAARG